MTAVFTIIAVLTLAAAIAAMSLRHLVHCALCAALAFGGLAALFLQLNAQFVGLAQVLVYVGAVAILIVFAILLTRGSEPREERVAGNSWWAGLAIAGLVWFTLAGAVLWSPLGQTSPTPKPDVSHEAAVQNIGTQLMTTYVLPLEIVGLLLTAATIGAVIIAMHQKEPSS
jgi:NADH:ubiquinone oxidoreductase subunit 6 (subunit J)